MREVFFKCQSPQKIILWNHFSKFIAYAICESTPILAIVSFQITETAVTTLNIPTYVQDPAFFVILIL